MPLPYTHTHVTGSRKKTGKDEGGSTNSRYFRKVELNDKRNEMDMDDRDRDPVYQECERTINRIRKFENELE